MANTVARIRQISKILKQLLKLFGCLQLEFEGKNYVEQVT